MSSATELQVMPDRGAFSELAERLATNKDVDVEKLKALLDMQERVMDRDAEAAFNSAYTAMVMEIPEINERGAILNKDGKVQSRYSKFEDIQKVVKPILQKHGFALSFETDWPNAKQLVVTGVLTHVQGHARRSRFQSEADSSGSKNAIQGLGSANAYGRRYTTLDLLNITTREMDDDGQSAGKPEPPAAPAGFDRWLLDMAACADNGTKALEEAWGKSKPQFRAYLTANDPKKWAALKTKAAGVGRA